MKTIINEIRSGGQTGVDRAGLDFAIDHDIVCGGWCPKGRKAEDGILPETYPLKETNSADYAVRTRKNILDSHGTLIIFYKKMDRGTTLTHELAMNLQKPFFLADLGKNTGIKEIREWIIMNRISILNIAGPRESHTAGIYQLTYTFLENLFSLTLQDNPPES